MAPLHSAMGPDDLVLEMRGRTQTPAVPMQMRRTPALPARPYARRASVGSAVQRKTDEQGAEANDARADRASSSITTRPHRERDSEQWRSRGVRRSSCTAERIRDDAAHNAFRELLRTAIRLNLHPQRIALGKETSFGFGPQRYPLCRVNARKGMGFHSHRGAGALIIRAPGDHAFRLATGVRRRVSLSVALRRLSEPEDAL